MVDKSVLVVCAALCGSGCATTVVRSGRTPLDAPPGYEERWHSAFLWGSVAGGTPYDLAQICPHGWSQVTLARDPFTLLAGVITLFTYSPARVSIVCAVPGGPALPPVDGYAASAPNMPTAPGTAEQP